MNINTLTPIKQYVQVPCLGLKVDDRYQRPIDKAWLAAIIHNYDPKLVRPLTISRRPDGDFIVDGNHTNRGTLAKIGSNATLPATIYEGLTLEQEAELFNKLNTNSKKVSFNDRLKARYTAKEPEVVHYIDTLNKCEVPWNYGSGSKSKFTAHNAGMQLLNKFGDKTFEKAATFMTRLPSIDGYWNGNLLSGLCAVYDAKPDLDSEHLLKSILKYGGWDQIQGKAKYIRSHDMVGTTIAAYGMIIADIYNKTRKKDSLKIKIKETKQ